MLRSGIFPNAFDTYVVCVRATLYKKKKNGHPVCATHERERKREREREKKRERERETRLSNYAWDFV
jgi:hypothetical protein